MADITTCREPGCPWCGSVITFDDSASHQHTPAPIALTITGPTHWDDTTPTPWRYTYPHSD